MIMPGHTQLPQQLQLSDVPFAGGCDVGYALGRRFLVVPSAITSVQLSPPPTPLPMLWRSPTSACFEVPLPTSSDQDSTTRHAELVLTDSASRQTRRSILLPIGVSQPQFTDEEDNCLDPLEQSPTRLAERVLGHHIESMSDIAFSGRESSRKPVRAESLTIASWPEFNAAYWRHDENDAPLRLIVRIADECKPVLESVCQQPRHVLQRERVLERLDRVQQMDNACLRWFVRQPGRSILEKAGPRQEVLCVVRNETADTHENRVLRDFLERSLKAGRIYLRENRKWARSYRVMLVRRFTNRIKYWLKNTPIADVPRLTGPPTANYVLQFDARYQKLWYWYQRLRRQQMYQNEAWRWQHRSWAEHCTLAVMRALSGPNAPAYTPEGRIYIRSDPQYGSFVDKRSAIGTFAISEYPGSLVHAIRAAQCEEATKLLPELTGLLALGPDLTLIASNGFRLSNHARCVGVWTSLHFPTQNWKAAFSTWFQEVATSIRKSGASNAVACVLIVPDAANSGDAIPETFETRESTLVGACLKIPLPVTNHLLWLEEFLSTRIVPKLR